MARTGQRSLYPVAAAVGVVAVFVLGAWGYARAADGTVLDNAYRSLQLFVLEAGEPVPSPAPWQLEIARLAAPAVTVAGTLLAAASLSRQRVDAWRARRSSGHVVVCGLGEHGTAAALSLRDAGYRVTVVDADAAGPGVRRCRHERIPVVVGDARDPLVLASAGIRQAEHLVVLTPSLEFTGQVALSAIDLVEGRDGPPLAIHVEVDDPALATLMRAFKLTEHHSTSWRIEELDLAGAGAALVLDELPPAPPESSTAHLLVVGDTVVATAVTLEARRRWRRDGRADSMLRVTLLPPTSLPTGLPLPTAAYVCVQDETQALTAALALVREFPGTPVLLLLEHATAFGELVHRDAPDLRVISLDRRVLTPEVLLDGTVERIARALHEDYRRHTPSDDPSAVPWADLPEQLRASNRAQASDVATKIRATHRVLVPDDGDPPDVFTDAEVDHLGHLEHDRWTSERLAAGWTAGPRDAHARTSPYLVPWEELDEDVREVDRQFVRALPAVLADAGLVLRRAPSATSRITDQAPRRAT